MSKKRRSLFGRQKQSHEPEPTFLPPEFDDLPGEDDEALESLSQLSREEVRPVVITPQEERFPPLNPEEYDPPKQPAPPASKTPKPKRSRRNRNYNLLSVLSLLGIVVLVASFVVIWRDPLTPLNPFPPPTPFIEVTATPASVVQSLGATPTFAPTMEILASPTSDPLAALAGPAASPTAETVNAASPFPFDLDDEVRYQANENGRGCEWSSIAGTTTGLDRQAVNSLRVRIIGEDLDEVVFTGAALTIGPGGFELPLGGVPQTGTYTVQLFTTQGAPLSPPVPITTRDTCEENVALLDFVQIRER